MRFNTRADAARTQRATRGARMLADSLERRRLLAGSVVINEIHFAPDLDTDLVEFVELHNPGDAPVNLAGASFTSGISYTFPAGAALPAGGYVVVAQNVAQVQAKFGISGVFGPFTGKLSNEGENVVLKTAASVTLDEVSYGQGFPWPTVGEAPGYSIELMNPAFDNNLGGNWRSHLPSAQTTFIASGSAWRYRKGTSEASSPTSAWRTASFVEDASWLTGTGPIGYDPAVALGTTLPDMNENYSSVFLRKSFNVANAASLTNLRIEALYDDGFNLWINGTLAGTFNTGGANLAYSAVASGARENGNYVSTTLPTSLLQNGSNLIAVQFFNSSKAGSSDAYFDARLIGSITSAGGPTPGAVNAALAANAAPQMRQLTQSPQQPIAGQNVTISMKVTDPQGVAGVTLDYQLVDPGAYIRMSDAGYQTNWTVLTMRDDGLAGDLTAGDGVYSVVLPGTLQTHRRLVRYRISATDSVGATIRAPYADDPQPNFAYFVYNGVPGWSGANQPGVSTPATFGTDITGSLAGYHVIANATDVSNSQYVSSFGNTEFLGTVVYDGIVYDHIRYMVRGEISTYVAGKNKWRFNFGRGHEFAARDNYGRLYAEKWRRISLNANASPWIPANRGMAGLDEAVSQRLYQLAGVQAPNTNYAALRVIDDAAEAPANQYNGDLWGLYLAIEHTGSRFIDEHGLEDGNIYEIEASGADSRNQSPTQPSDGSDWTTFVASASLAATPEAWWRANVNLDAAYSFMAMNRAVANVDLRADRNHVMYHHPDGHWQPIPWDLDMMYVPETHHSGVTHLSNALAQPALKVEYANRARELMDLLFSDASRSGGQVAQLVDEFARMITAPDGAGGYTTGWPELDQFLWNYHPRTTANHTGNFYKSPISVTMRGGTYTRTLASADFDGMVKYIIDFMTDTDPDGWTIGDGDQRGYGFNYLEHEALDAAIPNRPTVTYMGAAGHPANQLTFSTSSFSDPNGSGFAAMEWRLGEISNPGTAGYDPDAPWTYEITPTWESGELSSFGSTITVPAAALEAGHTYRLRVRMKDDSGRWSHWSDVADGVTQFVAGAVASPLPDGLRVTELHYNPAAFAGVTDPQDLEFIELTNISDQTLDLTGATFTGITFTFGSVSLAPGQSGVVVRGLTNFQSRYGTGPLVLGTYGATGTNFANGGEQVILRDSLGATVFDFTFDDAWYPTTDGGGASMEIITPVTGAALSAASSWRPSTLAGGTPGVFDIAAPSISAAHFQYETSPNSLVIQFSEEVGASIDLADIAVEYLGTPAAAVALASRSYDPATRTATFTFAPGLLPNGRYRATLPGAGVFDPSGNLLDGDGNGTAGGDYVLNFFSLGGDANHDGTVNFPDLLALAKNYSQSPRTFSHGDFNYDGIVSFPDLLILAKAYNFTMPAAQVAAPAPLTQQARTRSSAWDELDS